MTDDDGLAVSETRYLPFGEPYWSSGAGLTDKTYTGQRDDGAGLMDYNARMFSPRLGRFVSADTIVPGSMPVHWDRYAYTHNNPILYNDPTGHDAGCPGRDAGSKGCREVEDQVNPLTEPADAKLLSIGLTVGFNDLFWVGSLDLVYTRKDAVLFGTKHVGHPAVDSPYPMYGNLYLQGPRGRGSGKPEGPYRLLNENQGVLLFGASVSIVEGDLFGDEFDVKGPGAYEGPAITTGGSAGVFTGGYIQSANSKTGIKDNKVTGVEFGTSFGIPVPELHQYATVSRPLMQMPDFLSGLYQLPFLVEDLVK